MGGGGVAQGLGMGLNQFAQNYVQAKQQTVANRHQQAQDLYNMAGRYMQFAEQYRDNPAPEQQQAYSTMWQAASAAMDKGDTLVGEKGQGAWKAVRPILAKVIPGLQNPQKDDPHGTLMASGPQPAQGPPAPGTPPMLGPRGQISPDLTSPGINNPQVSPYQGADEYRGFQPPAQTAGVDAQTVRTPNTPFYSMTVPASPGGPVAPSVPGGSAPSTPPAPQTAGLPFTGTQGSGPMTQPTPGAPPPVTGTQAMAPMVGSTPPAPAGGGLPTGGPQAPPSPAQGSGSVWNQMATGALPPPVSPNQTQQMLQQQAMTGIGQRMQKYQGKTFAQMQQMPEFTGDYAATVGAAAHFGMAPQIEQLWQQMGKPVDPMVTLPDRFQRHGIPPNTQLPLTQALEVSKVFGSEQDLKDQYADLELNVGRGTPGYEVGSKNFKDYQNLRSAMNPSKDMYEKAATDPYNKSEEADIISGKKTQTDVSNDRFKNLEQTRYQAANMYRPHAFEIAKYGPDIEGNTVIDTFDRETGKPGASYYRTDPQGRKMPFSQNGLGALANDFHDKKGGIDWGAAQRVANGDGSNIPSGYQDKQAYFNQLTNFAKKMDDEENAKMTRIHPGSAQSFTVQQDTVKRLIRSMSDGTQFVAPPDVGTDAGTSTATPPPGSGVRAAPPARPWAPNFNPQ